MLYEPDQPTQYNLLIIRVDDLEARQQELVSVWFMFNHVSEQSFVTFKPLYPAANPDPAQQRLAARFDLTARKQPAPAFLKAVETYQVPWDGYILVDNQGMLSLHEWLGEDSAVSLTPASRANPERIVQEEMALLNSICPGLHRLGALTSNTAQWQALSPRHLQSDLDLQDSLAKWETIHQQPSPLVCKVFTR